MKKYFLACLLCFYFSPSANAEEKHAVLMATETSFHGDEIFLQNNTDVLVFGKLNNTYTLQKNTVLIDPFSDVLIGDDNTGKKTDKNVSLKNKIEHFTPEIILQASFLKEGPIESANIPENCLIKKGLCEFDFHGKSYKIMVDHKTLADSDTNEEQFNYDLFVIVDNARSQITSKNYPINKLYWAGDLDRDGKLDLITDGTAHYNAVVGYTLFLSSLAGQSEVLGFAGSVFAYGC